jgi:hypothetical protein
MFRPMRLLPALVALLLAAGPVHAADTTSTYLQLLLMDTGLHNNDWGDRTNENLVKIETAISGYTAKSLSGGSYSLTADEARPAALIFTGTLASNETVTVPSLPKIWVVSNQMAIGGFTLSIKTASGSPVTVPVSSTATMLYWCDGTNIFAVSDQSSAVAAAVATANGALQRSGGTMTGDVLLASGSPPAALSAAPKSYVDAVATTAASAVSAAATAQATANAALPLAGGTMSGAIAMGNSKITGLGTPTVSTDAATKGYVDGTPRVFAKGTFDTSGNILGGNFNIASVTAGGVATVNFTSAATSQYSFTCTVSAYGSGGETSATVFAQSTTTLQVYATNAAGSIIGSAFNMICVQ